MTEALVENRTALSEHDLEEAPLEAELLVAASLGVSRAQLYAMLHDDFPAKSSARLARLTRRRLNREPLAYILGYREFYGLRLKVNHSVLIPRPETELLVDEAICVLKQRFPRQGATIADVGVGSGAIAVALASYVKDSHIYGIELSIGAFRIAEENVKRQRFQDRITILLGDLLNPVPVKVDLIVANLPYIPTDRIVTLAPEIACFEPRQAMDGGRDGLQLVRRLLAQTPDYLSAGGVILLEMDPEQMDVATSYALHAHPAASTYRVKDLGGLDRILAILA